MQQRSLKMEQVYPIMKSLRTLEGNDRRSSRSESENGIKKKTQNESNLKMRNLET